MFKRKNTFKADPLFVGSKPIMIRRCDRKELMWVVPMLIGQALLTALMFL